MSRIYVRHAVGILGAWLLALPLAAQPASVTRQAAAENAGARGSQDKVACVDLDHLPQDWSGSSLTQNGIVIFSAPLGGEVGNAWSPAGTLTAQGGMEVMGSGNKLVVGPGAVVIDLSKTDPPAKTLQLFFLVQGSDAGDTHLEAIDWQTADTGTSSTSITSKASATRAGPIFDAKIEGAIRAVRISTSKPLFLRGICAAG